MFSIPVVRFKIFRPNAIDLLSPWIRVVRCKAAEGNPALINVMPNFRRVIAAQTPVQQALILDEYQIGAAF